MVRINRVSYDSARLMTEVDIITQDGPVTEVGTIQVQVFQKVHAEDWDTDIDNEGSENLEIRAQTAKPESPDEHSVTKEAEAPVALALDPEKQTADPSPDAIVQKGFEPHVVDFDGSKDILAGRTPAFDTNPSWGDVQSSCHISGTEVPPKFEIG